MVRLKGGDPFVFGRGGEEAAALRSAGVPVAVQPGVTAGAGIAAELGVPLTHRGLATSVRFLTGHERPTASPAPSSASTSPPPGPLFGPADAMSTLVVYMGLATLPSLVAALTGGGDEGPLDGATPAVAVERGTTPQQRRVFARLSSLAEGAAACGLQSPTLLLVGRCVALSPLWPPGLGDAAAHPRGWELQCGPPDADEAAAQAAEARAVVLPGRAAAAASAAPGGGGSGERLVLPARAAARDAAGATLSPWR